MPARNPDLHGNVPDKSAVALLLMDVINDLFTANDAYMRDYHLAVPSDCVASNTAGENEHALRQMEKVLKADITPSDRVDFEALRRRGGSPG